MKNLRARGKLILKETFMVRFSGEQKARDPLEAERRQPEKQGSKSRMVEEGRQHSLFNSHFYCESPSPRSKL